MDAVTYPDAEVIRFLTDHFVPVRLDIHRHEGEVRRHGVIWTPTFCYWDGEGIEYRRSNGDLPPAEFRADLGIGLGMLALALRDYDGAGAHLREVASRFAQTWLGPEAQYWLAVAEYRSRDDVQALIAGWQELLRRWPDSRWARSVQFVSGAECHGRGGRRPLCRAAGRSRSGEPRGGARPPWHYRQRAFSGRITGHSHGRSTPPRIFLPGRWAAWPSAKTTLAPPFAWRSLQKPNGRPRP